MPRRLNAKSLAGINVHNARSLVAASMTDSSPERMQEVMKTPFNEFLVLEPVTTLDDATIQKLQQFVSHHGKVSILLVHMR